MLSTCMRQLSVSLTNRGEIVGKQRNKSGDGFVSSVSEKWSILRALLGYLSPSFLLTSATLFFSVPPALLSSYPLLLPSLCLPSKFSSIALLLSSFILPPSLPSSVYPYLPPPLSLSSFTASLPSLYHPAIPSILLPTQPYLPSHSFTCFFFCSSFDKQFTQFFKSLF